MKKSIKWIRSEIRRQQPTMSRAIEPIAAGYIVVELCPTLVHRKPKLTSSKIKEISITTNHMCKLVPVQILTKSVNSFDDNSQKCWRPSNQLPPGTLSLSFVRLRSTKNQDYHPPRSKKFQSQLTTCVNYF